MRFSPELLLLHQEHRIAKESTYNESTSALWNARALQQAMISSGARLINHSMPFNERFIVTGSHHSPSLLVEGIMLRLSCA
jgi:hypothetical protein